MNSSLVTADVNTHLKILAVVLLAVLVMMWIGIAARLNFARESIPEPRLERLSSAPALPNAANPFATRNRATE
jgi:hypothetical protein